MSYQKFIDSYLSWLKDKITVQEINGFSQITTPFLDRHNDHLQIYIKQDGDKIILSDDGYVVNDLILSGVDMNTTRRKDFISIIVNSLGVKLIDEALTVEATADTFPQKKHSLIQAMISINDMFLTSFSRATNFFLEDVERFLTTNEVRFVSNIQFSGKSGFSHYFDFVIPKSKEQPERLIKAINSPARDKIQALIFAWTDTRESRNKDSKMFVFLNDSDKPPKQEFLNAVQEYNILPIPWTQKDNFRIELIN